MIELLTEAAPIATPSAAARDLRVVLRLANHVPLVLPAGMAAEVLLDASVVPIPSAPFWCAGITALRGQVLTVLNFNPTHDTAPRRVLMLRNAGEVLGLYTPGEPGFLGRAGATAGLQPELGALAGSLGACRLDGAEGLALDWDPFIWAQSLREHAPPPA